MICFKKITSLFLLIFFASSQIAFAEPAPDTLPTGYLPVSGSTSYAVSGNTGTLVSSGPATVGHWDSFSIGSQSTFNAQIEGAHLSKVTGADPSQIFGALNVQSGQFFLVNPNGILFGPSAQVNAPGLVASTLDMLENDFLAGRYAFHAAPDTSGYLLNQGKITAEPGGYVALIGRAVSNQGEIVSSQAGAVMAAGDAVTLSLDGSGLVSAAVTSPVEADVYDLAGNKIADTLSNSGTIHADGGYAVLTARSTESIFDNVINHSGVITANSVENKNGVITLSGGPDTGIVRVSGDMEAHGGDIEVRGNKIGVFSQADLDVSSSTGDGGTIIVYAEDVALAHGSFNAESTGAVGDGGFIETSGRNYLDTAGIRVSASSVEGDAGTWLLDPRDVTIMSTATGGGSFSGGSPDVFTPTADSAIVDVNTIIATLNAGTSVTVNTGGTGTQAGDITVAAAIAKTGNIASTLTLTAAGSIAINESITSSVGILGVIMTAGSNIVIGNGLGDTINANGGTVSLTATGGAINGNVSASTHISASSITLSSGVGIGTSSVLKVDTPLLSNASVSGAGLINISDASGGLIVTSASTSNGNISLGATSGNLTVLSANAPGAGNDIILTTTTSGDVLLGSVTAQDTVTVTSAGAIQDNVSDSAADISVATSVTLTAATGIGNGTNGSVDMNSPLTTASVTGTGGMSLNLLGGGVKTLNTLNSAQGDINVTSADSLLVGLVTAGTSGIAADVTLTTTSGFIKDNGGANDSVADIIGDDVDLTSVSGIGEANTSGSLDVNSNTVDADTGTGGIFINLMNSAELSNGLAANHKITSYAEVTGVGNIGLTGTDGSGDRSILEAETYNGTIDIQSADGKLTVDTILADTGVTNGTSAITIQAVGSSGGDLIAGYMTSDSNITLTATNGAITDFDQAIQNFSTSGTVDLNASGDAGLATNPLEHLSSATVNTTGVSGTSHLIICDKFNCGETTNNFNDATSAAYTSLFSDSFEDSSSWDATDSAMEESFDEESGEEKSEDEDKKDEEASDVEGSTTEQQTEQLKDIENDTPATENVTVTEQTFNPC